MKVIDDRPQPHVLKVERAVLAAMIINSDNLDIAITANLSIDCFYSHIHREIFSCMYQMKANGQQIDLISLSTLSSSASVLP